VKSTPDLLAAQYRCELSHNSMMAKTTIATAMLVLLVCAQAETDVVDISDNSGIAADGAASAGSFFSALM
jgi:hypothetical protein